MNDITIDPDIASLLAPHTPQELALLERSLLDEGCREPLAVWQGILLDGHARLDICRKHGVPFRTAEIDLPHRDAAVRWVLANQLARRNLIRIAAAYYRGVLYRLANKQPGKRNDLSSGPFAQGWASEEIARRFGVDERTVRRDAKLADDLDAVAGSLGDGFRGAVLSGETKLNRRDIGELASMSDAERKRADAGGGRRRSRPKPPPAPTLDLAARLADLWRVAGREERLAFLRMVDLEEILDEIMAEA
jgi:hypothetical protein